jgi:hypothetical protein
MTQNYIVDGEKTKNYDGGRGITRAKLVTNIVVTLEDISKL